ncbi:F-box protein SKIP23 [Linum perenne]
MQFENGGNWSTAWCYFVAPLLIVRIVGEFVDEAGEMIKTTVMIDEDCVYRTIGFEVYTMDEVEENWVKTENLGENRAVFLGEGHSVLVPATGGIAADCIYYSDDYWDKLYDCGGHDIGVFNLRDGKIKWLDDGLSEIGRMIDPPPSWIVPSPSGLGV